MRQAIKKTEGESAFEPEEAEEISRNPAADRTLRMGTDSVPKLLLEFAIPSIAGMLINGCYNIISSVFLGQAMGATGLAVTTAAFPITIIFMALAMLVGNGGNALAALRLGQGSREGAELSLGNTVLLALIVALVIGVFTSIPPCMELLLSLASTTPDIHDLTRNYVWILSIAVIFQIVGMGVNNFIRSCGAPNRALLTMLVGAVVSVVLNYLFVMRFGWGVEGSALATILGQAVSCGSVLWYFLLTPKAPIRLRLSCMRPDRGTIKEIVTLGMASFLLQVASCVCNLLVNYQLVKYGAISPFGSENALAAIGVVSRLAGLAFMPIIGVSAAAQPLLGYNYGAGNMSRVRQALGFAFLYAFALGTLLWLVTRIWPVPIVMAFGVQNELMDLTVFALQVQMLLIPLIGVQVITSNYFQATGQPGKSIFLSMTRQIIFLIPALLLTPVVVPMFVPGLPGLQGLFASWPTADLLSVFTAGAMVGLELKRLKKIERGELRDKYFGGGR